MCDKCKVIKRNGKVMVICSKNKSHKQRQGWKSPRGGHSVCEKRLTAGTRSCYNALYATNKHKKLSFRTASAESRLALRLKVHLL